MTELNRYIPELINGTLHRLPDDMEYDWAFGEINPKDYQHFIPELCFYIESEQRESYRNCGYLALNKILLPDMDQEVIDFLINRLVCENENKGIILIMLEKVNIPATTDQEPLKREVRKNHSFNGISALKVFGKIEHGNGEVFLLEVLRRTEDAFYIYTICDILKDIGSFRCPPVLMAILGSYTCDEEMDNELHETVNAIASRMNVPEEIKGQINDPDFWKMGWAGTLQEFVNYITRIALVSGDGTFTEEQVDHLGDIYIEAMGVNISPYNTYRELRICSKDDPDQLLLDVEKVLDGLQSMLLMDTITNGTGITKSEESFFQGMITDLMTDYLTTRLRRYISFANDDY